MQTDPSHISGQFIQFLVEQCRCSGAEYFLLTVSGGIDSMVMLDLFSRHSLKFAIAHCNFNLRGKESDGEEEFVRQTAASLGKTFFARKFNTGPYAKEKGISIQMAARELRYQWFNELVQEHRYDLIATAHNRNDSVETFLINLSRGTGITGLTGIRPRNGNLVRPLLFLTRDAITAYAKSMKIAWKEDSSNASVKYLRNKIRHILLPEIRKVMPEFDEAVIKTMVQLRETEEMLSHEASRFLHQYVTGDEHRLQVDVSGVRFLSSPGIILYEVLQPYGFHYDTVERLLDSLKGQPGKQFFSRSHELTVDRSCLIIRPLQQEEEAGIKITQDTVALQHPVNITLMTMKYQPSATLPADENIASFDMDRVRFPLTLRRWKKGDFFFPLGMKGRKKLSDFFTDRKVALPDKKRVWILESDGNVIWVVGMRIDDRYKVTASTQHVLQITCHPPS